MRLLFAFVCVAALAGAQLTVSDPNLSATPIAGGLPGVRHQIGVEAVGTLYVAEEVLGGFNQVPLHRVTPAGVVTLGFITQSLASVGQMVRNPADGAVYLVSHWQGALEHNWIARVEPAGTLTTLTDILWGEGHGLCQDAAGNWYLGTPVNFFTGQRQIWTVPAGQLGAATETAWHPGVGANRWLAPDAAGSLLVADTNVVWRVAPGQPTVAAYSHVPASGAGVEWRGLLRNPFGAGHVVSVSESAPGSPVVTSRVLWIGPGGARELAQAVESVPGDFAIADDGQGGLVVCVAGNLYRLNLASLPPVAPGQLLAAASQAVALPMTVTITGRPFALTRFVFAVDRPLGPPAFPQGVLPIPPFGVAHTSLGILPTFLAIRDGLGAFRPADPIAFLGAGGTFSETYVLPPQLAGLTLVLQAYLFDAGAASPLTITPPVFTTFS